MSSFRFAWRIGVFAAVMIVLLMLIVQVIRRPVVGAVDGYTAIFTDANGLHAGDDVRMYGLPVGKVESLALDGANAKVRFSVQRAHAIFEGSTLAIRYQTLAGQRYLEVRPPARTGARLASGATIGADRTVPSFDITALFDGLQPILAGVSPDAINRFAESMLAVLEGDGSGLGQALNAIEQLSAYVSDRQTVISTLIRNLREMSDALAGRSPHMVTIISGLADVFASLEQKLQGVVDYAETIPPVLQPLDDLAARLGLSPGADTDVDRILRAALPDPDAARDVLARLPGLLQTLDGLSAGAASICSHGPASVPAPLALLIDGRRITICQR
ncbi:MULTISPECIES: MlaD family protein [unclassified Nocardia]|uniref:MlaD family protein n=1 Tax=unclassified Nocardia TaxID=2637762 RepID=UPI001CE3C6F9|nr:MULTISPECIES: MCE family protein [unclassified Nocardia]